MNHDDKGRGGNERAPTLNAKPALNSKSEDTRDFSLDGNSTERELKTSAERMAAQGAEHRRFEREARIDELAKERGEPSEAALNRGGQGVLNGSGQGADESADGRSGRGGRRFREMAARDADANGQNPNDSKTNIGYGDNRGGEANRIPLSVHSEWRETRAEQGLTPISPTDGRASEGEATNGQTLEVRQATPAEYPQAAPPTSQQPPPAQPNPAPARAPRTTRNTRHTRGSRNIIAQAEPYVPYIAANPKKRKGKRAKIKSGEPGEEQPLNGLPPGAARKRRKRQRTRNERRERDGVSTNNSQNRDGEYYADKRAALTVAATADSRSIHDRDDAQTGFGAHFQAERGETSSAYRQRGSEVDSPSGSGRSRGNRSDENSKLRTTDRNAPKLIEDAKDDKLISEDGKGDRLIADKPKESRLIVGKGANQAPDGDSGGLAALAGANAQALDSSRENGGISKGAGHEPSKVDKSGGKSAAETNRQSRDKTDSSEDNFGNDSIGGGNNPAANDSAAQAAPVESKLVTDGSSDSLAGKSAAQSGGGSALHEKESRLVYEGETGGEKGGADGRANERRVREFARRGESDADGSAKDGGETTGETPLTAPDSEKTAPTDGEDKNPSKPGAADTASRNALLKNGKTTGDESGSETGSGDGGEVGGSGSSEADGDGKPGKKPTAAEKRAEKRQRDAEKKLPKARAQAEKADAALDKAETKSDKLLSKNEKNIGVKNGKLRFERTEPPLLFSAASVAVGGAKALLKPNDDGNDNPNSEAMNDSAEAGKRIVSGFKTAKETKLKFDINHANSTLKHAQKTAVRANVRADYASFVAENPNKNALSRSIQKRRIKREYAAAARKAQRGATAVKAAGAGAKAASAAKAAGAAVKNPVVIPVIFITIVTIIHMVILVAIVSAFFGAISAFLAGSYLAEDGNVNESELYYYTLESDLLEQIADIESVYSGYDEYIYNIDVISHNTFELLAYITVMFGDFVLEDVVDELDSLFAEQYELTMSESVETRYRETEDGGTEAYEHRILSVRLTAKTFTDVINGRMDEEQKEHFGLLMETKGQRQYTENPLPFDWLTNITKRYDAENKGVEMDVPANTPVKASIDGIVTAIGTDTEFGQYISIEGEDGVMVKFARLSSVAISVGDNVNSDDTIGYSTEHLRFEVLKDGEYLNPVLFALTADREAAENEQEYGPAGEAMGDGSYAALIAEAERYLGYPYVWGGSSPSTSFDCSGFVCWVYTHSGVKEIGRTTAQGLYNMCDPVPPEQAQPGDLIFLTGTYSSDYPVTHVGIYVGGGRTLHCGDPIQYTSIETNYWQSHFYAFGRLK